MNGISAHVIVLNEFGQILLTQRNDVPIWVIPGGHVEDTETPNEAACREVCEEVGLNLHNLTLVAKYGKSKNEISKYLFWARIDDTYQIKKSLEVKSIKWVSASRLPVPMTMYEKAKIFDYLSFHEKVIYKKGLVNKKSEIIYQLKNPFIFLYLLVYVLKNQLTTRSFKL